jgi:hypothetical protein
VMVTLRGAASCNGRASRCSTRFGNRMIIHTLHGRRAGGFSYAPRCAAPEPRLLGAATPRTPPGGRGVWRKE